MPALSPPIDGYAATPAAFGGRFEEGIATLNRRVGTLAVALLLALGPANTRLTSAVAAMAKADAYSVDEDQALAVEAGTGVLANDTPSSGTCVVESTDPANGSLGGDVASGGSFMFTPLDDFNGQTTFTYGMAVDPGTCPTTLCGRLRDRRQEHRRLPELAGVRPLRQRRPEQRERPDA
jgi:hypothetical protein